MFGRRERVLPNSVVRSRTGGTREVPNLKRAFPDPIYRRKLGWEIRREAAVAVTDWELYVTAAGTDARLLPRLRSGGSPTLAPEPPGYLGRRLRAPLRSDRRGVTERRGVTDPEERR